MDEGYSRCLNDARDRERIKVKAMVVRTRDLPRIEYSNPTVTEPYKPRRCTSNAWAHAMGLGFCTKWPGVCLREPGMAPATGMTERNGGRWASWTHV